MSGWIAALSLIGSGVAIVIAVWAHVREHRLSQRMVALEESREQDRIQQKQKAELVARAEKEPFRHRNRTHTEYYLRIENLGLCEARDIAVLMDGMPILDHPAITDSKIETRQVGPKSHFKYLLVRKRSTYEVSMTWSDDSGQRGSYKTNVTL